MAKYIIEGGINFYDELYKSLDTQGEENNVNICCITNEPLTSTSVKLECGHMFNYDPLYKEITQQKFVFKTYNYSDLNEIDKLKCSNEKRDFYIRCPYCRNIQFNILPYYDGYNKVYGINTLMCGPNDLLLKLPSVPPNYMYKHKGYLFSKLTTKCCSKITNNIQCTNTVITEYSPGLFFCCNHLDSELLTIQLLLQAEKKKAKEEKLKAKEEKMKVKEEKLKAKEEKMKAKEEKLKTKEEKLKTKEDKIKAKEDKMKIVIDLTLDSDSDIDTDTNTNVVLESNINGCHAILKSGVNKGNMCGCKIFIPNFCKKHIPKT